MMHIEVPDEVIVENLYLKLEVGRDLFDSILEHYGKDGWNAYSRRLLRHSIWAMYSTPEPTDDDESCMPVHLELILTGADLSGRDLAGLDLSILKTAGANFASANLSGSVIGDVTDGSLRGADLRNANLDSAIISGADFDGARLDDAVFGHCKYFRSCPPRNLPKRILASLKPFPPHWDPDETPDSTGDALTRIRVKDANLCSFWGALA